MKVRLVHSNAVICSIFVVVVVVVLLLFLLFCFMFVCLLFNQSLHFSYSGCVPSSVVIH